MIYIIIYIIGIAVTFLTAKYFMNEKIKTTFKEDKYALYSAILISLFSFVGLLSLLLIALIAWAIQKLSK